MTKVSTPLPVLLSAIILKYLMLTHIKKMSCAAC